MFEYLSQKNAIACVCFEFYVFEFTYFWQLFNKLLKWEYFQNFYNCVTMYFRNLQFGVCKFLCQISKPRKMYDNICHFQNYLISYSIIKLRICFTRSRFCNSICKVELQFRNLICKVKIQFCNFIDKVPLHDIPTVELEVNIENKQCSQHNIQKIT